jgi:hypothetical protein
MYQRPVSVCTSNEGLREEKMNYPTKKVDKIRGLKT